MTSDPFTSLASEMTMGKDAPLQQQPGFPNISLEAKSDSELLDFLEGDLCSKELDNISGKLWLFIKQDSGNISPLHRHLEMGRTIIVTEDPKLHLIRNHNHVYIKAYPSYLTSKKIWKEYIMSPPDVDDPRRERILLWLLGYVRTYCHLIKDESDFHLAQEQSLSLFPSRWTWDEFSEWMKTLEALTDRDVAQRYHYGEIRFNVLNIYAPILLGRLSFQRIDNKYGEYFSRFYIPSFLALYATMVVLRLLQRNFMTSFQNAGDPCESLYNLTSWTVDFAALGAFAMLVLLGFRLATRIARECSHAFHVRFRLLEQDR